MKFLIIFIVAIVAVSGKPVTEEEERRILSGIELSKIVKEMKAEMKSEMKDIDAAMKADNGTAVMVVHEFMSNLDKDIRTQIVRDTARTVTAMIDTTKSVQDRYLAVAEIAQNTADLWKLAAKKYIEQKPTVTGSARAA